MAWIMIPDQQKLKEGDLIMVFIDHNAVYIPNKIGEINTGPIVKSFESQDFNRDLHGYEGINDTLEALCKAFK